MIVLLSPAKALDFSPTEQQQHSMPRLLADSEKLVKTLKKKSSADIKKLMKVSDNIANLNVERYQNFQTPFHLENAKQAVLAFKGDVYTGLEAETFEEADFEFAQTHIRILSGLYGVLKPLDLMQPYRLEMGTRLKYYSKKNLYEFWDNRITKILNSDLEESKGNIILNLASQEYFKSVKTKSLKGQLVTVNFKENRNGVYKVISFNAKKARGAMANQIIKNKITDLKALESLDINGYLYNPELSKDGEMLFVKD